MATAQLGAVLRHIRNMAADQKRSEQADGALLRSFLGDNDQPAFAALMRRHGPMVLRVCQRTLGNAHDAEDAFQATFLVLAQRAKSIRRRESLASWLHGVAYRMATHAKRAAARRHRHESRVSPTQAPDPALSAAWQEIQVLLDEEIAGLPETLRAPFILCCLENKSSVETARQLSLEEGTVWKRLSRARKLLQKRLTRRGVSLTAVLAAAALRANRASAAVPRSLVGLIVKAAARVAAGRGLRDGLVSAQVINLLEGVNQAMLLTKAKTAILLFLGTAIIGAGIGAAALHCAGAELALLAQPGPQEAPRQGSNREWPKLADARAQAEAKDSVTLHGRVLGPDGKPFAGAKLYLKSPVPRDREPAEVSTSGDDGRFKFAIAKSALDETNADHAPPQVMAVAKGFGCDWAAVGEDGKTGELTLRLVKDVPINGRILDPDGKQVVGAKLTVTGVSAPKGDDLGTFLEAIRKEDSRYAFAKNWTGPLPGQTAPLTTGADGRFKLAGVGRERVVHFQLEGPAIARAYLRVMTRAGDKAGDLHGASFDYLAQASRPIRGVVRDKATGKPIPGVELWSGSRLETRTDREGRYEVLGLAKYKAYGFMLRPANGQLYFGGHIEFADTPGLDPLTADIELAAGTPLRGKIMDKTTGKPVPQARVVYHPLALNPHVRKVEPLIGQPHSEATSGADGTFTLGVLPGPGVLGVAGSKRELYLPALVTPKDLKDFFKNWVLFRSNSDDLLAITAGGNSVSHLVQQNYNALVLLDPDEKAESLTRNVVLEPGRALQGSVVGPDGQPFAGVTAYGLTAGGTETLKSDTFTVRAIDPRRARPLLFLHRDKDLGFFTVLRKDESGPLTIKLQPCGSVTGRIVDKDGQPVAETRLWILGPGHDFEFTTGRDGRFRAGGLVPGAQYSVLRAKPLVGGAAEVVVEPGKNKDLGDVKGIIVGE